MSPKVAIGAVSLLSAAVVLAGCSSSSNKGSGTNRALSPRPDHVTGKDNSGLMPHLADAWNKDHANEKVTIKQQSDQADQQLSTSNSTSRPRMPATTW